MRVQLLVQRVWVRAWGWVGAGGSFQWLTQCAAAAAAARVCAEPRAEPRAGEAQFTIEVALCVDHLDARVGLLLDALQLPAADAEELPLRRVHV